ncbi:signal peptidase I [Actinotalea solisilvae]|uniref:signal peptidase I n=1 Tax=Actinotalea solisilvae TaxID=2072922 RepID=UPI0018F19B11|nr:signal peptidase I [Actinotalea solisilvae]
MLRLARVVGASMAPTLRHGDLLVVARAARSGRRATHAHRGDVVVLEHAGTRLVKRLVGVPGDVVELEAGRLAVGGRPLDGGPPPRGAGRTTWHVPPGHVFVAGDDPAVSDDSRVWDDPFVPDAAVRGVVVARVPRTRPRRVRLRRPAVAARQGR